MSYQLVLAPDPQGAPPADHQYQVTAAPVVATAATPVTQVNKEEIIFVQVLHLFFFRAKVSRNVLSSSHNIKI